MEKIDSNKIEGYMSHASLRKANHGTIIFFYMLHLAVSLPVIMVGEALALIHPLIALGIPFLFGFAVYTLSCKGNKRERVLTLYLGCISVLSGISFLAAALAVLSMVTDINHIHVILTMIVFGSAIVLNIRYVHRRVVYGHYIGKQEGGKQNKGLILLGSTLGMAMGRVFLSQMDGKMLLVFIEVLLLLPVLFFLVCSQYILKYYYIRKLNLLSSEVDDSLGDDQVKEAR